MPPIDTVAADAPQTESTRSPWLTASEAATRARCSVKMIYATVKSGKLRAARLGVRNELRIHESWVDAWITAATLINPDAPGAEIPPPTPFRRR
jgi:excisionase family DNA binding protein